MEKKKKNLCSVKEIFSRLWTNKIYDYKKTIQSIF